VFYNHLEIAKELQTSISTKVHLIEAAIFCSNVKNNSKELKSGTIKKEFSQTMRIFSKNYT